MCCRSMVDSALSRSNRYWICWVQRRIDLQIEPGFASKNRARMDDMNEPSLRRVSIAPVPNQTTTKMIAIAVFIAVAAAASYSPEKDFEITWVVS
jgi:hypothetical protein